MNGKKSVSRRGGMKHNGPSGSIGRPVEKAKDFKKTLKRLMKYLKPYVWKLASVFLFAIFATAFTVLAPRISGNAINQLTDGFIAKHAVAEVSKAQDSFDPALRSRLTRIDAGRTQAEKQAAAAARAEQVRKGASQEQIAAAQRQASAAADQAFEKKLSQSIAPEQLQTMRKIVRIPRVAGLSGAKEKADAVEQIASLSKKLPHSGNTRDFSSLGGDLQKCLRDIRETNGAIPFGAIAKTLLFLLIIYVFSSLFTFLMRYVMADVSQDTVHNLRKDLNDKLARLPLQYFDGHTSGDILSRMTNDIDTISGTLQQSLTQLILSVCQILGYIIMMLIYSPVLTLIVLCTLPLYIGITMLVTSRSQKYYKAQQEYLGDLSGHTEEMFTGHVIVKAFGREKESVETFEQINDDLYDVGWKAQFMSGIMFPLMNFVSNIGYVLVAVIGGVFVTKSLLNIGDITAFIQYSRSFSMPIIQTANIANIIQSTIACAERVFEVLDEKEEDPDPKDAVVIDHPKGNIRFDHVKFRYERSVPLMEDMNLSFKQGETVAIVGPTGAGKTTLVNLLMRFYEIDGGAITFDGVDIRRLARGNLRTMFGMVLQDTWLFSGTIEENIAYGQENATHEQVVAAAKAAHADHFIRSLPGGYQTVLNEEASNISQGQKQLLTIARALLANPTVLILDEATSSVDTRTEVLIQKAMGELMKGRTSFIIAHRLSTIRDAHLILVMNHGTIIETGNHRELMAKKGFYADLYNSQFLGTNPD